MSIRNLSQIYPTGPTLATSSLLIDGAGGVIWIDSATGSDSNTGLQRNPYATLAAAVTANATNYGMQIFALVPGHAETISTAITISNHGVTVLGLGTGSQKARLTNNVGSSTNMITASGLGVELNNIVFPASTVAAAGDRVNASGAGALLKDCDFTTGANEDVSAFALNMSGAHGHVSGCTFTATSAAGQLAALGLTADYQWVENCSFDGGATGWYSYALAISTTNGVVRLGPGIRLDNKSLITKVSGTNIIYDATFGAGCVISP